jgi:hypothetical protein
LEERSQPTGNPADRVLRANLFIPNPIRNAYPNTQSEVSVTNRPELVVRKHPRSARLQGVLGKTQVAQYADLAFQLKTDKGRASASPGCSFLRGRKSCSRIKNSRKLEREPLGHLGMSRGDGRCACGRTLCLRLDSRFTEMKSQKEPKPI